MKEVEYDPQPMRGDAQPTTKKHWTEDVAPLRTYSSDVASALRSGEVTKTKIVLAEKTRQASWPTTEDTGQRGLLFAIGVTLSLFALLAIVIAVVFFGIGRNTPIADPTGTIAPASVDREYREVGVDQKDRVLDISSGSRPQIIADLRILSRSLERGSVSVIKIIDGEGGATPKRFFEILGGVLPTPIQDIGVEDIMLAHAYASSSGFTIIARGPYEKILSGMLRNERFIARASSQILDPFDESTPPEPYSGPIFRDGSVAGEDVRILRRVDGSARMVWGIINENTLLISPNEASFGEVAREVRNIEDAP